MNILKWEYEPSGLCPVQSEGWFLGYYFYFRARWDTASIEFAETREDWEKNRVIRRYSLKKYAPFEAGYIPRKDAKMLIYKGLFLFTIFWPSSRY